MPIRKEYKIAKNVLNEISNIFETLEEHHGELCYEEDKTLWKIRNALCRCIDNYGGYRVILKAIVKEALKYFDEQQEWFYQIPIFEDEPNPWVSVMVLAAHLCQKYNLQDEPELLNDIMIRLFRCDGGFVRLMNILDPLIFPNEVEKLLYPVTNFEDLTSAASTNHLSILEYFLREAGHVRVDVTFNEWDFLATIFRPPGSSYVRRVALIDAPVPACRGSSPLLLSCQALHPDAVLLLLRYGAKPVHHHHRRIMGWQFQHPLYHIIMKLNVAASWKQRDHAMDEVLRRQFNNAQATQETDALQCLVYFSRAMLRLPLCENEAMSRDVDNDVFYLNSSHLQTLPEDRWKHPANLQHITRCRIRHLLSHVSIPNAISRLPLPKLIKSYLDLYC